MPASSVSTGVEDGTLSALGTMDAIGFSATVLGSLLAGSLLAGSLTPDGPSFAFAAMAGSFAAKPVSAGAGVRFSPAGVLAGSAFDGNALGLALKLDRHCTKMSPRIARMMTSRRTLRRPPREG